MKRVAIILMLVIGVMLHSIAQKSKAEKVKESEVPKTVKDAYENNVGFPVQEWLKLTIGNGPRFIAVTQQMNSSSGKMLSYRYRYNAQGKITSTSQYRGTGKDEGPDFFSTYLGTGDVNADFEKKVNRLVQDNEVISFEAFDFIPGNEVDKYITTHRFVFKDKKAKSFVLYFDHEGKEIDMTKYPIRKLEAEELD